MLTEEVDMMPQYHKVINDWLNVYSYSFSQLNSIYLLKPSK